MFCAVLVTIKTVFSPTVPSSFLLLECPITTEIFQKNGYDLNAYNNVRDILHNNDVITNIVKSLFTVLWEN